MSLSRIDRRIISPYDEPEFEIQRTGQWRGKDAFCINKMGRRTSFVSGGVQNDILPFLTSTAIAPEPTGGENFEIVSSSANDTSGGTGAQTVIITYIDNSYNQAYFTATMNGTTPVALTGLRAFAFQWAEVTAVGALGYAEGTITIRIAGAGATHEQIPALGNKTLSARYMVPDGYTGYLRIWACSAINQDMDVRLRAQARTQLGTLTTTYLYKDTAYPGANSLSPERHLPYLAVPSRGRVKISAIPAAISGNPRCEASFTIVVIQN